MTITTTSLGSHTTQITLSGESSATNFINALDTAITNGGWAQYDVSNPYNRIYSCANADGQTYKLIGIFIDPGTLKISTTSYELWNKTTHVGVNETWTYNKSGTMGYSYNGCDVIVMVSSKWLFLQTFINNQMSPWSGVVELAREAPEDTPAAGYPCWAWVSSVTLFSTTGDTYRPFVSLPRTVAGATSLNACAAVCLNLPNGNIGATIGSTTASLSTLTTYGWNTNETLVQQARPLLNLTELHGQMFGLKFTSNIGSPYNQISVPVDSNFNFSASGSAANHWVMGANPNTASSATILATSSSNTNGYCTSNTTTFTANAGIVAIPAGTNWFAGTTGGVYTSTSSGSTLSSFNTVSTGTCLDLVYDGYRYVYASSPSGVTRIDTQNSNATSVCNITNGTGVLFWDGSYLWAGTRLSSTANTVYQIDPTSFAVVNTISVTGTGSAFYICGICSDYQGNTYVATSEPKVYKITNNVATSFISTQSGTAGYAVGLAFNGDTINFVTCGSGTTVYYGQYTTSGSNTSLVTYATSTFQTIAITGWLKMNIGKLGFWDFTNPNYVGSYGLCLGSGSAAATNPTGTYLYNFNCDGNKAWGFASTTFIVFTNLYHPDETTTTFGRVLIPT